MKLNFEKLLEKLNKKLESETKPNPKIGATIKTRRKQMGKTLEDVSLKSGYSLSYISKIENNQLNPNFNRVKRVLSELNLNEDIFDYPYSMTKWYNELLDLMLGLSQDENQIKNFFRKREDFQSKLIELSLYVKKGSLKHCESHISLLLNSIDQMMPIELGIFMLSIAHFYYLNKGYIQSAKTLEVIQQRHISNKKFLLWQDELTFKLSLLTKNVLYIDHCFNRLTLNYQHYGLLDKAYDLRVMYHNHMQFIAGTKFYDLDEFDNTIDTKKNIYYNHLFCGYKNVIDLIDIEDDKMPYRLILALAYDKLDAKENVITYISQLSDETLSEAEALLLEFLKHKYMHEDYEVYLRHALFKDTRIYHNHVLLDFYSEAFTKYYKSQHRYKECVILNDTVNKYRTEIRNHFEKIYTN